ncbi:MAG: DUF3108 domain-containing protein [Pyrinomonadaceae bacterium]|nr:DUF3108 domain-containing protein [Pyrinomonadaceae bacterium]MCX7639681.1 DUF3108 domain-containing protein [Pyrinomonadaceae bacterium]MDW8304583.1 DUF3108 domain-containing protein [Acidobacteriota bacterium]
MIKAAIVIIFLATSLYSQSQAYKIGERISYNVSFEKVKEAGYVELWVASQGKYKNEDAIELRAIIKTTGLLSAIHHIDQNRVCLVSAKTGLPLYNRIISNEEILPKDFVQEAPAYHNLITAIYQIRFGSISNLVFQEGEKLYSLTWQNISKEKVKTDLGEFETSLIELQSDFFNENQMENFRINITEDENRLPVLIRFRTKRGSFTVKIASFQIITKEPPMETPQPPQVILQPTPTPTPKPYIENQPLSEDLPFSLGETLTFNVMSQNRNVAVVTLQAKERRLFKNKDALLVKAEVTQSSTQLFSGSLFVSWIDPLVLVPFQFETKLPIPFVRFNQSVEFDQENGFASDLSNGIKTEIPVGTHSILSLAYAIRTFRIDYQRTSQKDVRVAVFWNKKYYILTFRPVSQETLEISGRKIESIVVSITGEKTLDRLNARLWISNDNARLPLRFMIGDYRADLISVKIAR